MQYTAAAGNSDEGYREVNGVDYKKRRIAFVVEFT